LAFTGGFTNGSLSNTGSVFGDEVSVRPAFERLGDFLIASELLADITSTDHNAAFQPGGSIYSLMIDSEKVGQNTGTISALSILLPEKFPGTELPSFISDKEVRADVLNITIESFSWRDPASFSDASESVLMEGLRTRGFQHEAMNAVLSISWLPSTIDVIWIDKLLKKTPLSKRDAFWCGFLHNRYESYGAVRRLIDAAFELPLGQIEVDIAERWAIALVWFTAAADRRVKDRATRAVVALFTARPEIISKILTIFLFSDDDEVREHVLLSCYGALIISRNTNEVNKVTSILHEAFRSDPTAFANALIRDHIRSFIELSDILGVIPADCNPELPMRPIGIGWPLELPSEEEITRWRALPRLAISCLYEDFYIYSLDRLREWIHGIPKDNMGKWILKQVAEGLAYEGSGCERYDSYILGKYGDGRGKETWAERISKKYQWIAMYQLASHLHDHIERKRETWEPEYLRNPLILQEGRKLDPTLPSNIAMEERDREAWWIGASVDIHLGEQLPDIEWVTVQADLPSLEDLLTIQKRDDQKWQLLVAYPTWGRRDEDADWDTPYRQVWIHIESHLVPKDDIVTAYDCLHRRNFFGLWMPEGATWLHGFAGEYPWATPFNIESEEWHGRGGHVDGLPVHYKPSYNKLAVEWEYDASLARQFQMLLPARLFFTPNDLWWNGKDGYRVVNGRTVFRDPSITEVGPKALISDADDLLERLKKVDMSLIWTLLGEKWILGGPVGKPTPRRTFSQIARLKDDGSIEIGERVFFDDYKKDASPLSS